MRFPHNPLAPGFWDVLSTAFTVLVALIVLAIIAGLIFLLVRFLLVGTRAAELYIARNTDTGPIATVPEAAPTPVAPVAPEPPVASPTKPLPRTRTPKAPPTI